MQYILGLSGRKQSGKNTTGNFLLGLVMRGLGLVRKEFVMSDDGKLWISDILGDENFSGIFDYYRNNPDMDDFKDNLVHPYIKLYSFADNLKQVCIDVLGLTYEQCYGTDDDKNSETHYRWENMPGVTTIKTPQSPVSSEDAKALCEYYETIVGHMYYHEPGPMTARDVMQYVGTDIFRRMYSDVWVDATIRQITNDNSGFAIITDLRFPNEVEGVQKAGGKVMRFTRNPFPDDDHFSETALDKENFDWEKFDWIIDNADCSVLQQCNLCQQALVDGGWLENLEEPQK